MSPQLFSMTLALDEDGQVNVGRSVARRELDFSS